MDVFLYTLAMGDDCIRDAPVGHHNALYGFKAAFSLLSTLELALLARQPAESVE